jgi:hypothetical protein
MITFKDVTVPTLEGQYWAVLNPLGLLKVIYGGEVTTCKLWQSGFESEQDFTISLPMDYNFHLLRFSHPYSNEELSKDLLIEFEARTGDVFEAINGMLVFAVLSHGEVILYSDAKVPGALRLISSVVQRGPGPQIPKTVLNRYDRIINAHKPNIPLVRSVDRVLLRPKEQGTLRLSNPNTRSEDRVFSNLDLVNLDVAMPPSP